MIPMPHFRLSICLLAAAASFSTLAMDSEVWAEPLVTPGECDKPLDELTRTGIAKVYNCHHAGECIDAQIGQAFWLTKGTLDQAPSDGFYTVAAPGKPIGVRSFALQKCASSRLAGIRLRTVDRQRPRLNVAGGGEAECSGAEATRPSKEGRCDDRWQRCRRGPEDDQNRAAEV